MQDMDLIQRAQNWFGGLLPLAEDIERFAVHVAGPRLGPRQTANFHSFACFYPLREIYIAGGFRVTENPEWRVDALKIREVIAAFEPSEDQVLHQRRLAEERVPGLSAYQRWLFAVATSDALDLPVMLVAFGHTDAGELVAYTSSAVMAPLRKVATEMKRVAPQISMN